MGEERGSKGREKGKNSEGTAGPWNNRQPSEMWALFTNWKHMLPLW